MNLKILALSIVASFSFDTFLAQSVSNGNILQLQAQASAAALSSVPASALTECNQRAAEAFAVPTRDVHAISAHRGSDATKVVLRNTRNNAIANCSVASKTATIASFSTGSPTTSILANLFHAVTN